MVPFGKYKWIEGFDKSGYCRVYVLKDTGVDPVEALKKPTLLSNRDFPDTEYFCKHTLVYRQWGIINYKGEEVLPCQYDEIWKFIGKDYTATKIVKDGVYDYFYLTDIGYKIREFNKYHYNNYEFYHSSPGYDYEFFLFLNDIFGEQKNNDRANKIIVKNIRNFSTFSEGLAAVQVDDKWGYMDMSGEMIIKPQFKVVSSFSEGLACVKIGENYGYIDRNGKLAISPKFAKAGDFSNGLARVQIGGDDKGEWFNGGVIGYIDREGTFIINPQYYFAGDFHEGLAAVRIGDMCGYINREGITVIEPQFLFAFDFSLGLARVYDEASRCGYINRKGEFVIEPQFFLGGDFSGMGCCCYAPVLRKPGHRWNFIDCSGNFIIKSGLREYSEFSENVARVKVGDKWGYMNKFGQIIIKPIFDEARDFHEGMAAVKIGGKYGFINYGGSFVINPQYEYVFDFSEGLTIVVTDDDVCYINKKGDKVISTVFYYE